MCLATARRNHRSDSPFGHLETGITWTIIGTQLELQSLLRDAALILIAVLSLTLMPDEHREANGYSWEPIRETAILFGGIFITIIPVLAMLDAGRNGAFAWLILAVNAENGPPERLLMFKSSAESSRR